MLSNTPSYYILLRYDNLVLSRPLSPPFSLFVRIWYLLRLSAGKKTTQKKGQRNLNFRAHYLHCPKLKHCKKLSFSVTRHRQVGIPHSSSYWNLSTGAGPDRILLLPNILKGTLRFYVLKYPANMYTPNTGHVSLLHTSLTLQNFSFFFFF